MNTINLLGRTSQHFAGRILLPTKKLVDNFDNLVDKESSVDRSAEGGGFTLLTQTNFPGCYSDFIRI